MESLKKPDDRDETRVTKLAALERLPPPESCLVVIYGPELGKRIRLENLETTVGRDRGNDVVLEMDNVSRRHCVLSLREGGKVVLKDCGSTNGTYLNDEEVSPPGEVALRGGDLVKVGSVIFKFLNGGNVESLYHEEIYRMTIVDGLTEVHNKRYFMEFVEREMARCHRYGRALSLVMIDLDHFKHVNDEFGHLAGDHVLREMAGLVKAKIRKEELIARFGGEEFAIVMPESGPEKVRRFAEKVRALVGNHLFEFENRPVRVTLSIGVVDMQPDMIDPSQFIRAADQCLLQAKKQGRNRVVG